MKKSTLITTIAMIVVVVVALSTATYAWFSASTASIATTNISTTAAADWIMTQGNVTLEGVGGTPESSSATFTGGASDTITLNSQMANGLFAPSAPIATASSSAATTVITGIPTFYEAKVSNTTVTETALFNNSAEGSEYRKPDVIKVQNSKSDPLTLKLSVVINVGSDVTTMSKLYAAAATSFYVQWQAVGSAATPVAGFATNGYYYNTAVAKNATFTAAATQWSEEVSGVTKYSHNTTARPDYATIAANSFTTGTNDEKLGLVADDHYLKYDVTIGSVPANAAVYVTIYTWIDGWVADANAAGAAYAVKYAFTTVNNG